MEVDERFSKVAKDPRYKTIDKKKRKVKIDSRFEKMFTDERFHTKFSIDKRGKKISETEQEDLHKFYDLDSNNKPEDELNINKTKVGIPVEINDDVSDGKASEVKKKKKKKGKLLAQVRGKNIQLSGKKKRKTRSSKEVTTGTTKISFDDIRGETLGDDSNSDDSDEFNEDEVNEEEIVHGWGDLDENVKCIENAETSRLAVCNCDWDKIGANDLFLLFDSFKPVDGVIKSVKIYPSEFGIERMKEEKVSGPKELKETVIESDEEDKENEEGSRFHMEKLREYQLNRLKYYYAVVECNSTETANKIYEELDGKEYEMSATRLDLRFIPEDTTFVYEPKSVASGLSHLNNYEPISFHNTALQQSTVRLTWDDMDARRAQATMRKFTKDDIENMDFKDYLASSSEEEEDVDFKIEGNKEGIADAAETNKESKRIEIYKELMQEIEAKEEISNDKQDMEVSFKTNMISNITEIPVKNSIKQKNKDIKISFNGDRDHKETSDDDDDVQDIIDDHEGDGLPSDNNDRTNPGGFDDPFFSNTSTHDKKSVKLKKKRKRHQNELEEKMTESEKNKKNELELLMLDESEDKKHFNLKNILNQEKIKKSKRKTKNAKVIEEDTFKIDVVDPRFGALYSSHLYALDPSEPNFRKTTATEAIIEESQRRRNKNELENMAGTISTSTEGKHDSNLSGVIKSVKSRTKLHKLKKERKKLN